MRYYFAGAYARRAELDRYAGWLLTEVPGALVTSRWLTQNISDEDAGYSADGLIDKADIERAWECGQTDLEDLSESDAIVSFTGEGGRGGRHIEHGVAISYYDNHPWDLSKRTAPMRLIVIGLREHVSHCHPATEQFDSWETFLTHEIKHHREETTG